MHSNPIHCKLQIDYPCIIIFKLHLDWNYLHIWAPMATVRSLFGYGSLLVNFDAKQETHSGLKGFTKRVEEIQTQSIVNFK